MTEKKVPANGRCSWEPAVPNADNDRNTFDPGAFASGRGIQDWFAGSAMMEKPLEAGSGLGTASQAFAQAADCERLAMLTPEGERRHVLRALRCAWIQLGAEIRTREIVLKARKMRPR
jgi:hypothetical protein